MSVFLSMGSNEGDRRRNLGSAIKHLKALDGLTVKKISPVYETPPLLPEKAPTAWLKPFLNLVVEAEAEEMLTPHQLLESTQRIEQSLGRKSERENWAPRPLDIDLLMFDEIELKDEQLQLPHPEVTHRSFVLDPLKDIAPILKWPGLNSTLQQLARSSSQHAPLWMAIINLTPDSFSDGGEHSDPKELASQLHSLYEDGAHIFDFGAESTRPNATLLESEEERSRLEPALHVYQENFARHWDRPLVSLDTRHVKTANWAQSQGPLDFVNDVSGLEDPEWLSFLKDSDCNYILMHSQSIPADPKVTLPSDQNPTEALKVWLENKLESFAKNDIPLSRVVFDPGIGFGKTAVQSLQLMKGLREFFQFELRTLVGHSRKSFMNNFTEKSFADRDAETVGVSLKLIEQGVDILRVHNVSEHHRSFLAWNHLR